MRSDEMTGQLLDTASISVDVVDGEIVLSGFATPAPALTIDAARVTARRLMVAAALLEAKRRGKHASALG